MQPSERCRLTHQKKGLQHVAVPTLDASLLKSFAPSLPATIIVLLVEHIAISKSFGRINNYVIDPSQEMVAMGVTNALGPFLGAFPSTGSFSRTAIKSKAGVRTPLAGLFSAAVVLLAIYALPAVFFYIPSSALAAVIIHAVGDLIATPNTIYGFWRVSPLEVLIWFVGVFVSVFSSIENGIYATVAISAAVLFYRILKANGQFLGKVRVHTLLDHQVSGDDQADLSKLYAASGEGAETNPRNVFLPISHGGGSNPDLTVDNPYPGIFIYRFSEGFDYPNANRSLDFLTHHIYANTRRTSPLVYSKKGDRPWNQTDKNKSEEETLRRSQLPTLKAVILDLSSVNNVDITSVQRLIEIRNQLDAYTSPDVVDWHIACINNAWTKRALASSGFGYPTERSDGLSHRWKSIFNVADIGGADSAAAQSEKEANRRVADEEGIPDSAIPQDAYGEVPEGHKVHVSAIRAKKRPVVVNGLSRPLFHVDLTSALSSAIANVEARVDFRPKPDAPTSPQGSPSPQSSPSPQGSSNDGGSSR